MKKLSNDETLEVLSACLDLLARRESEIRDLYDRLQAYEPDPAAEGRFVGAITPDVDETRRNMPQGWPKAIAVCGTPLVGRSLILMCPQVGLRVVGITDSGLDGLKLTEKHKPDYAFVDLDISDIDGLVLISRLKEIAPDLTIVALSGISQESTLVSAIIAGATEVIGKPLQTKRLLNTVGKLLKRRRRVPVPSSTTLPVNCNPKTTGAHESWSVL
jgi:CheY-like chemotaxis protein